MSGDVATPLARFAATLDLGPWRRARRETLALVAGLSQEEADRRPRIDKWSVGEVLDHLLKAERYFVSEIEVILGKAERGEAPELKRSFVEMDGTVLFLPKAIMPWIGVPFGWINGLLSDSWRRRLASLRCFPIQTPGFLAPERDRAAGQLSHELDEASDLTRLETRLQGSPTIELSPCRYEHPFLGQFDLPRFVEFAVLHEQRHQAQIGEILACPDAPTNPKQVL